MSDVSGPRRGGAPSGPRAGDAAAPVADDGPRGAAVARGDGGAVTRYTFTPIWDDRASAFRVDVIDSAADLGAEPTYLPGPHNADGSPLFAASCAAAMAAQSADHDERGLTWSPEDSDDAEGEAKRAAEAAGLAMSPLTRAEDNALKMLAHLGLTTGAKKTIASLKAKWLVGEDGKATPAGRVRAGAVRR